MFSSFMCQISSWGKKKTSLVTTCFSTSDGWLKFWDVRSYCGFQSLIKINIVQGWTLAFLDWVFRPQIRCSCFISHLHVGASICYWESNSKSCPFGHINRSISFSTCYTIHIYFTEYTRYFLGYEMWTGIKVAMLRSERVHYQHTWKWRCIWCWCSVPLWPV